MTKSRKDTIFKTGIWIKEQQGRLTIGSLDENEPDVMVVPDHLCAEIFRSEQAIMEALYGDQVLFDPAELNVEKLLADIRKEYEKYDIRVFFAGKNNVFKGSYQVIHDLVEKLIQSSLVKQEQTQVPTVFINVGVLENHLCIIYRDSLSISDPLKLSKEFDLIRSFLGGEISHKTTSGNKSYYDIVVPSSNGRL